ncbi:hypothetical protein WH96_03370 [Kiloniella spongiae]|uniref:SAM-dependent methyltransferase n=1 Tax=Kiloniella spongiae TaxID=1489064 RepID=A0A0H2MP40_9PROT|nr:DUF938 domain-containing protein [Kiloniella spongiae]KLN62532.1 hypothetical protein WH96_03370 [Kiloniella spongiae]
MTSQTTKTSSPAPDARRYAPATERNRQVIFEILKGHAPEAGTLLEIASGTGEHAAWIGSRLPTLTWQTSEYDTDLFPSITAHIMASGAKNITPPIHIDTTQKNWGLEEGKLIQLQNKTDAIICANMIHIAPWEVAIGLIQGASKFLTPNGFLFIYGPFFQSGVKTALSNIEFDNWLKKRDSSWGIRQLDDVKNLAQDHGLLLHNIHTMPANNLFLQFKKISKI